MTVSFLILDSMWYFINPSGTPLGYHSQVNLENLLKQLYSQASMTSFLTVMVGQIEDLICFSNFYKGKYF